MDELLPGQILAAVDILSLEWRGDGLLTVVGLLPEWVLEDFEGVWSEGESQEIEPFEAAEFSPFLDNFMVDAQQYWEDSPSKPMRSGIWTQIGMSGEKIHLEAIALLVNERPMILIESSEFVVAEKAKWLQSARQEQLNYLLRYEHAAAKIDSLTVHDPLTALHNRTSFISRLNSHFDQGQWSEQRQFALLVLDLDHFSALNNSLGSAAGDQVLITVAGRIRECLRKQDISARFDGDEFGVLVSRTEQHQDVITLVERLLAKIAEPFLIDGQQVRMVASVGIAVREDWHKSAQDLLGDANLAMRHAKEKAREVARGQGEYVLFEREMRSRTLEHWHLESDLQHAIERCELELWYQPVINLATHRPESFEALLRWVHPVHGTMLPDKFLPLAEASGLIVDIDQWVLNMACQTLQRWQSQTSQPIPLSVNFSNRSFAQSDWFKRVEKAITHYKVAPKSLCLEINERLLLERNQPVIATLTEIKTLGITMTIDDCSTGYASLNFLRDLSLSKLKMNSYFIDTMQADEVDIVATIIDLAHKLNCGITAKRVETIRQYKALQALGCDAIQGYLVSRPAPMADAQKIIGSEFVISEKVPLNRGPIFFN